MKIGFTGTRHGMTQDQHTVVTEMLSTPGINEFHHGDCLGSDVEAGRIAFIVGKLAFRKHPITIVIHPPVDESHRAFHHKEMPRGWFNVLEPKTHFARNRDIVNDVNLLIATPYHDYEESSGGTWYTINYARKQKKTIFIVWPNGSVKVESNRADSSDK